MSDFDRSPKQVTVTYAQVGTILDALTAARLKHRNDPARRAAYDDAYNTLLIERRQWFENPPDPLSRDALRRHVGLE